MATRTTAPPAPSVRSLDTFRGMSRDRTGMEQNEKEFYDIKNWRVYQLQALRKRKGAIKVFSQTDASGSKVRGVHTFVNDAGTETYLKMCNQKIFKSTGGSWTEITANAPTWVDADCYFATLNTKKTGASSTDSGTSESGESTALTDTDKTFTVNAFVEHVLTVNGEIKLITANDATTIFVQERFDTTPSTDAYTVIVRQQEFFVANGTNFYKCDGTTFTRLDNLPYAHAFEGVTEHVGRLFGWRDNRLFWSDLGVGEHFSRNAWRDFATPIKRVVPLGDDIIMIYEEKKVTAMFGDSPDTFRWQDILVGVGCNSPKTIANYHGLYQIFLSEDIGVVFLSEDTISPSSGFADPLSVSNAYIQTLIDAQTSANIQAACGAIHLNEYHLCIDNDWYVLNIRSTERTRFRDWIWTRDTRPAAQDANVLGHFGGRFVAGAQDNGQVYEIEESSTYTDDTTTITGIIEKQNWNPKKARSTKKFWKLAVTQGAAAATCNMVYYADADGTTYGTAIKTIDLFTAGTDEHEIPITANHSLGMKNTGKKISYKITESSTGLTPDIEQIELLYYPGIVR